VKLNNVPYVYHWWQWFLSIPSHEQSTQNFKGYPEALFEDGRC